MSWDEEEGPGGGASRRRKKPREKRVPIKPTQLLLSRAALAYVERYPSTVVSLTRALKRKLDRYERLSAEPLPDGAREWIAPIVKELVEQGFVNDQRLAEAKTASLQRRGKSKRAVAAALQAKGVTRTTIDEVLAASEATDEDAAWNLARKKKLGPYRDESDRKDRRQKDLGAMARAGFSFLIARAVIESETPR